MGTIKATNIEPIADNGTVTLGSSGDTFSFASGVTGTNYPAFEAHLSSSQALTDITTTKVQFDNEIFDTDNCYDNSTNYRFTPTVSGKYFVYSDVNADPLATAGLAGAAIYIYKNGVAIRDHETNFNNNYVRRFNVSIGCVIDMNGSSDYLEIFVNVNDTSGNPQLNATAPLNNFFGAYRIGT